MLGCNSKADVYLTIISLSRHDDHRCRSKCWAGGLEIRLAGAHTITPATGQTATSTIARIEFQMIGACGNRSDDDGEATIAVNVGCNDPKFHRRNGLVTPCRVIAVQAPPVPLGNWPKVLGNVVQKM
jgi:hypothetical protein